VAVNCWVWAVIATAARFGLIFSEKGPVVSLSVAGLLLTLPAGLLTTTLNMEPSSDIATTGVV
jgi:hypothetical protein